MDRRIILIIVLIFLALASILLSTSLGAAEITTPDTAKVLWGYLTGKGVSTPTTLEFIILNLRFPRALLGFLVGASLAVAGATFQGLLQNPLADPYTIGVSSGAAVGATLAFLLPLKTGTLGSLVTIPFLGFLGGGAALFVVYQMARIGGKVPVTTLLLAGVVVSSFLSAVISVLMLFAGEALRGVFFWLAGGLVAKGWFHVQIIVPYFLLGSALLFYYTRDLNVLLIGEDAALSLGIEVEKVKRNVLLAASLLTAAAVSISGMIGFVGLIIPHAVRIMAGPDHRFLIPASALAGGIFLIWADVFARMVLAPSEIPVGIITAFLGAPFFMYLLRKRKHDFRL